MFNRIPKWVKEFPYDMDREALLLVHKSTKGSFEKPREMNFVIYGFANKANTESATALLNQNGWQCTLIPQADAKNKVVIEAKKDDYSITEENYLSDVAFFNRVADMYDAKYDGWYASD